MTLTKSSRQLLAVLLLVAVLAAAVFAVWYPINQQKIAYQAEISQQQDQLTRYQRTIAQIPVYEAAIKEAKGLTAKAYFLTSKNNFMGANEIQTVVRRLAGDSGAMLTSMQIPVPTGGEDYRRVTVAVQMTSTQAAAWQVLHGLQANTPYLFVDNVALRSEAGLTYQAMPKVEPMVTVEFDVYGYLPGKVEKKADDENSDENTTDGEADNNQAAGENA